MKIVSNKLSLALALTLLGATCALSLSRAPAEPPAAIASKPGPPVEISAKSPGNVRVGGQVNVQVTFTSSGNAQDLIVWFAPTQGVTLADTEKINLGDLAPGKKASASFTATVNEEGTHRVDIFYTGRFGDREMGSTSSVSLSTGKKGKERSKPGKIIIDDSGEKILDIRGGTRR